LPRQREKERVKLLVKEHATTQRDKRTLKFIWELNKEFQPMPQRRKPGAAFKRLGTAYMEDYSTSNF
jgi:hypothetical protein